jgi:hypothetical protein
MKTLIASVLSVAVGLFIGWHFGHRHAGRQTTEAVQQLVETTEASDAAEAARDARAIGSIESGDTKEAVRLLSTPVAHYYAIYGDSSVTNERRSKLRGLIEQVAKTNQVVASSLSDASALGRP